MQLTYKELQGKLKAFKEQGYQLNVKLNAKAEVLQKEWERIIAELEAQAQDALTPAAVDELQVIDHCNFFPATNTQEVDPQSCYTTEFKGAKLFVIGGTNYFMHEVVQWLRDNQGATCEVKLTTQSIEASEAKASLLGGGFELPGLVGTTKPTAAAAIAQAQCASVIETQQNMVAIEDLSAQVLEAQPLVASPKEQGLTPSITALLGLLLAVLLLLSLSICSKLWLRLKALALATGEPTCTQATENVEWLLGCASAFISGFLKL